jgi:hypothetical protein
MTRNQFLTTVALVVVASATFGSTKANAQSFGISWYTIGGGGYSTGSTFELDGTIGQHDAGAVMTGGGFELTGGFWAGGVIRATLGDANGDGVFNNLDIAAFVLALINPIAYQAMFPDVDPDLVLDMNGDGVFNNLDIAGFVAALTGGGKK